ncbi:hypothetical protein [Gleimia europaea]|uniref:Integral membrane protein n=1 Tax=Gleimia europaea ACS-120-V-Col10b TaxID=883069 RepID=A0A9W5VW54_9ACTO|nr:hypothetical protein [Gleimia europaea]EPD30559.1 hypothetical protein HMPREF9238_00305 [Gleimia europaea ACS-120-V-Col10b]
MRNHMRAAGAEPRPATDNRGASYGGGRVVMAVFWVCAVYFTYTAFVDFVTFSNQPIGPRVLSLIAALGYILIAISITHNGRRMRIIGWTALLVELAGVLSTGIMGLGVADIGAIRNVWANFGAGYYYAPLILPVIGLVWIWFTNPRRIVEIAESFDRK